MKWRKKGIAKKRIIIEQEDLGTLVEKTAFGEYFSTNTEMKFTSVLVLFIYEVMRKCMKGMTQNRNEHLHSKIWKITLKHRGASPRIIKFAATTAVALHNAGYEGGFFSSLLSIKLT